MRLFHFSEESGIARFEPRPVRVPSERAAGMEWLNGPLVWAIDEVRQPLYLFPRDCPRILLWPGPDTRAADRALWLGDTTARVVAFIETPWVETHARACIHRYELPTATFEDLQDAGMWASRRTVEPVGVTTFIDLPAELVAQGAELRVVESLWPLVAAHGSSLGFNGLRLRHAGNLPDAQTF